MIDKNTESRPNPDPSALTTEQILRENEWLKELLASRIDGDSKITGARFEGMDKALLLLQARADKVPSETDIAVGNLKAQQDERFKSIEVQFTERDVRTDKLDRERDVRTEKLAEAVQKAIDAAFLAQKDKADAQNESNSAAIAKSENSTNENIKALGTRIDTSADTYNDKFGDLKDRMTTLENRRDPLVDSLSNRITALENRNNGVREGSSDANTKQQQQWGFVFGIAGVAIAVGVLIVDAIKVTH